MLCSLLPTTYQIRSPYSALPGSASTVLRYRTQSVMPSRIFRHRETELISHRSVCLGSLFFLRDDPKLTRKFHLRKPALTSLSFMNKEITLSSFWNSSRRKEAVVVSLSILLPEPTRACIICLSALQGGKQPSSSSNLYSQCNQKTGNNRE